ncbi:hypothetical protein SBRCBS47491_005266 [Sporothrix bragantina]|uniref:Uncharacterized protein n=1 Tax=Sporothrix bragantina TaxID=671064 RepID=A0ABP0BV99_9PEZI
MLFKSVLCVAAVTGTAWAAPAAGASQAACKANLAIDNFADFANKTNSLGAVNGDDKTMTTLSVTGTTLSLNVKANSYFYENLPCQDLAAASSGYNAVSFKLSGPAQSSLLLELQTKTSCNATAHASAYHNVTVPATAGAVSIPLSEFTGANLAVATSLTFSTFNKTGAYTLSDLEFVCAK